MSPQNPKALSLLTFLTFLTLLSSLLAQSDIPCNLTTWPNPCPQNYDPVCVPSPKFCITTPCFQTADAENSCLACTAPRATTYTPGRCKYVCGLGNLPPTVLGTRDNPVCGYYEENCNDVTCRTTFRRSTIACQDPNVISFALGACEDDGWGSEEELSLEEQTNEEGGAVDEEEPIDNMPPEITLFCDPTTACPGNGQVCVTGCVNAVCRRTEESSCVACSDPTVLTYTPGACEAERIQCPPNDVPPTDVVCVDPLNPVCGYEFGCTEEPCGTTGGNVCETCKLLGSDYYIKGACPV